MRLQGDIETFAEQIPQIQTALRPVEPKRRAKPAPGQKMHVLIQLTGDAVIARLNEGYRGKKGPTDVLSFCYAEKGGIVFSHEPYGEIYISHATAKRQARSLRHSLAHELLVLAVHGALHVMGYDHEKSERGRREMQKLENAVITRLAATDKKGLITR